MLELINEIRVLGRTSVIIYHALTMVDLGMSFNEAMLRCVITLAQHNIELEKRIVTLIENRTGDSYVNERG